MIASGDHRFVSSTVSNERGEPVTHRGNVTTQCWVWYEWHLFSEGTGIRQQRQVMLSQIRCACCAHVSIFFGSRGALILLLLLALGHYVHFASLIDRFSLDRVNDIQFNTKSIYIGSCPAVQHVHVTLWIGTYIHVYVCISYLDSLNGAAVPWLSGLRLFVGDASKS